MNITHSYIVTAFESCAIAQRQVRWLAGILPNNWELIFVDDGSDPAIDISGPLPEFHQWLCTNDRRPWTQGNARNIAAKAARGEWLLMTDIDHVFTARAIEAAERFSGNILMFERKCGMLNDDLTITALPDPVHPVHPNTFLIRRSLFSEVGGYDESLAGSYRPIDVPLLRACEERIGPIPVERRAHIYVIPEERETFHSLPRR